MGLLSSAKKLFEEAGGPPTLEALAYGILKSLSDPADRE